ncbi:hypothetical protein BD779DRAFT_295346 [Infundibulicybe gibba]|nr:hypothetical protein BD779DRAFT_295346 [Infundibulicybe gibba]
MRDAQEAGKEQDNGESPNCWKDSEALDGHPQAHLLVDIAPPHSLLNTRSRGYHSPHESWILDDPSIPQIGMTAPKPRLYSPASLSTPIQSSVPSQHMATPTLPAPPTRMVKYSTQSHQMTFSAQTIRLCPSLVRAPDASILLPHLAYHLSLDTPRCNLFGSMPDRIAWHVR